MQNDSEILTKDQQIELSKMFRPNTPEYLALEKVKSFLTNNKVKTIADTDLRINYSLKGITQDSLIDEEIELLQTSKREKQLNVTYKVIEGMKNSLGMNDKVKVTEKRSFSSNLDQVQDTIHKVKAEKQQVLSTEQKPPIIGPPENQEDNAL